MADESISSEMPNPEETSPMVDSDAPVDQGSEKPQEAFSTPASADPLDWWSRNPRGLRKHSLGQ